SVIARRDALIAVGGFDESLPAAQDFDLWLAVLARSDRRFVVFGDALVRYRISPEGITARTGRRLVSTLRVALRFLPALRARGPGAFADAAFRAAAVHYEAFAVFRKRRAWLRALAAAAAMPVSAAILLIAL